jgi:hypothetical protein
LKEMGLHILFNARRPDNDSRVVSFNNHVRVVNSGDADAESVSYTIRYSYVCPAGVAVNMNRTAPEYDSGESYERIITPNVAWNISHPTVWRLRDDLIDVGRVNAGARFISRANATLWVSDFEDSVWYALSTVQRCDYDLTIVDVAY